MTYDPNYRRQRPASFLETVGDIALAPFRGIEGAAQDVYGLVDTLAFDALPDWENRVLGQSSTFPGAMIEGISNFAAGFVPVVGWAGRSAALGRTLGLGRSLNVATKAAKAAGQTGKVVGLNVAKGAVAGAITDFAVWDGNEARLSNLIQSNPALANPISEFLAADEDDPEIIGRIKTVLEGAALGMLLDPLVETLSATKAARKMRAEGKSAEAIDAALTESHPLERTRAYFDPERDLDTPVDELQPLHQQEALDRHRFDVGPDDTEEVFKGAQKITERLLKETDDPTVSRFMEALGPRMFDDVGLQIREAGEDGWFDYADNVASIARRTVKEGTFTRTTLHELWHGLERHLPEDRLAGIRGEFQKELDEAVRRDPSLQRRLATGERLSREDYRYGSFEEWFAETMTDRSLSRLSKMDAASRSVFAHAKLILSDIITSVKAKFGHAKTQAALNDFFKGRVDVRVQDYSVGRTGRAFMNPDAPREKFLERLGVDPPLAKDMIRAIDERPDDAFPGINPREKNPDGSFKYSDHDLLERRLQREDLNLSNYHGPEGALQLIREFEDTFRGVIKSDSPHAPVQPFSAQHEATMKELGDILQEPNPQRLEANLMRGIKEDAAALAKINARARAYKTLMLTYGKQVRKMADEVLNPSTGTKVDTAEFARQMEFLGDLVAGTKGILSEQGRGLGANRIPTELADLEAMTRGADDVTPGSIEDAVQSAGGQAAVEKMARKVKAAFGDGGVKGTASVTQLLEKGYTRRIIDVLNELFINSILSGLKTMTVNVMGGGMMAIYRPLEHLLGGAVDYGLSSVRGADTARASTEMRRAVLTIQHTLTELTSNFSDSFRLAKLAAKEGQGRIDPAAPIDDLTQRAAIGAKQFGVDPDSKFGAMIDLAGRGVRIPSAILGGTDEFLKQVTARGRTKADLAIEATQRGLKGNEAAEWVHSTMNTLFSDGHGYHVQGLYKQGLADAAAKGLKGDEATKHATQFARTNFDPALQTLAKPGQEHARAATFTQPLDPKTLPSKIQRTIIQHPYLRLVMPFVRTPTNIAYHAAARLTAPYQLAEAALGLSKKPAYRRLREQGHSLSRDLYSGDPVRQTEAIGRVTAAAGMVSLGLGLAFSGKLTGRGPADPEQRSLLMATGWSPYSYQTEDGYVQFSRLDPFSTLFGTIADLAEYGRWAGPDEQGWVEELVMGLMVSAANNFTNKSYLTGVKAAVEAISDPERGMESFVRQYAGAAVPNVLAQSIVGPQEDYVKDVRSVLDTMMSRTPGLSDEVEDRRNVLGEPLKKLKSLLAEETGGIADAFLPIAYSRTSSDVITNELKLLKHGFTPPKTTHGGVDLTAIKSQKGQTAYDRWSQLHGQVKIGGQSLRQALTRLIKDPRYQAMPAESTVDVDSPRVSYVKRVISRYRRAAWAQLLTEYPEVADEAVRIQLAQARARSGR